jgi:ABC-type antimicrobial peptide transport system permease subunit
LAFTVGDAETAAANLTVTASSSNTALVPNANVVLGGSGASRTVTVTPLANQSGTTTVTVTVNDGAATASDTFTVDVRAVNDAPTISDIANQAISEDANTGP